LALSFGTRECHALMNSIPNQRVSQLSHLTDFGQAEKQIIVLGWFVLRAVASDSAQCVFLSITEG
jgi:hypothetical protein